MTQTLTTEAMQDIYEAAVREEATGNPDESGEEAFDLLCLLDATGGTGATIRKLIDMVRLANREAQPVAYIGAQMLEDLTDGARGCGRVWASYKDVLSGDGRLALYTAPPAPTVPVTAVEHQRVILMLLGVCGAAFELADDCCQQEVDGELCHVVPGDSFKKLSDALDEIENTLPDEYEDLPNTVLKWAAVPRHALRAMLNHSGDTNEKVPDDTRRMDWLVAHHVEVRKPLLYGSEKFFTAQTLTDEEDDYHATSLREQIDAAMAAAPTPTKAGE